MIMQVTIRKRLHEHYEEQPAISVLLFISPLEEEERSNTKDSGPCKHESQHSWQSQAIWLSFSEIIKMNSQKCIKKIILKKMSSE